MIRFFQRRYPSANAVLLTGPRPILVDPGFGADVPDLLAWLESQDVAPGSLALIVNTHAHCDHAGGNHALQRRFAIPVAAERHEAAAVNARDPDACRAWWLDQPIEPYRVDRPLDAGDRLDTGSTVWQVVATPGHTNGHISLHAAAAGILVLGDALHDDDLGWLNPYREAADSLERAAATVERLARLPAQSGYSGHGPAITDLPRALDTARRRLRAWREDARRVAWHACKRIFAHGLMLQDGVAAPDLAGFLLRAPWFVDHARRAFAIEPTDFVPMLVEEMLRAGAAVWSDGRLRATAPYTVPRAGWPAAASRPAEWPPI